MSELRPPQPAELIPGFCKCVEVDPAESGERLGIASEAFLKKPQNLEITYDPLIYGSRAAAAGAWRYRKKESGRARN